MRVLLLEVPLIFLFGLCLGTGWVYRTYELYLEPQLRAVEWTYDRTEIESTYYYRECLPEDVSTANAEDLFLPESATAEEVKRHQMTHGATVVRGAVSNETTANLRKYIVSLSKSLAYEDQLTAGLQEKRNRFSFHLGTEHLALRKTLSELFQNQRLVSTIEAIMGPNPSLVEMTTIGSSYGAAAQQWHQDTGNPASAKRFGRSFVPLYSLFVPLQDTTAAMGATGICPGTYHCELEAGDAQDLCDEHGFSLVNSDGVWHAGDALIYDSSTLHRGSAHTDPNAPARVLLILSFAPRFQSRAESRQMSLGTTYFLRWDLWGHTLQDLAHADTAMVQPWRALRALGLYKKPDAQWGIDYVKGSLMRMATGETGFEQHDLQRFVKKGGFQHLPRFLQGHYRGSWVQFLLDTLLLCRDFLVKVTVIGLSVYVVIFHFVFVLLSSAAKRSYRIKLVGRALFRLIVAYGCLLALFKAASRHMDHSPWAVDIRAGRLHNSSIQYGEAEYSGPVTEPERNDVLIEQAYGSDYLFSYNDFVEYHPGNRPWRDQLQHAGSAYASDSDVSPVFLGAFAKYMVDQVRSSGGRFLYQDRSLKWIMMSQEDSFDRTRFELVLAASPVKSLLRTQLRFLLSECKYGWLRDKAMTNEHTVPFLNDLKTRLLGTGERRRDLSLARPTGSALLRRRTLWHLRDTLRLFSDGTRQGGPLVRPFGAILPLRNSLRGIARDGDSFQVGDVVDAVEQQDDGVMYWFKATILAIPNSREFEVEYHVDGIVASVKRSHVRAYKLPQVGEDVDVNIMHTPVSGTVMSINCCDGTFNVWVEKEARVWEDVADQEMRRKFPESSP